MGFLLRDLLLACRNLLWHVRILNSIQLSNTTIHCRVEIDLASRSLLFFKLRFKEKDTSTFISNRKPKLTRLVDKKGLCCRSSLRNFKITSTCVAFILQCIELSLRVLSDCIISQASQVIGIIPTVVHEPLLTLLKGLTMYWLFTLLLIYRLQINHLVIELRVLNVCTFIILLVLKRQSIASWDTRNCLLSWYYLVWFLWRIFSETVFLLDSNCCEVKVRWTSLDHWISGGEIFLGLMLHKGSLDVVFHKHVLLLNGVIVVISKSVDWGWGVVTGSWDISPLFAEVWHPWNAFIRWKLLSLTD